MRGRRGRPSRAILVVLLVATGLVGAFGVSQSGGTGTAGASGPRLLGPTRPSSLVRFSLVLRLHQGRLQRFLAGLYDPRSPLYHHFIDARTFGSRFGGAYAVAAIIAALGATAAAIASVDRRAAPAAWIAPLLLLPLS